MKKLLTVMLAAIMLLAMVACGNNNSEPTPEPTPTPDEDRKSTRLNSSHPK